MREIGRLKEYMIFRSYFLMRGKHPIEIEIVTKIYSSQCLPNGAEMAGTARKIFINF